MVPRKVETRPSLLEARSQGWGGWLAGVACVIRRGDTYTSEGASGYQTAVLSVLRKVTREDVRTEAEAYAEQRRIRVEVADVHDLLPGEHVSEPSIESSS